MFIKSLWSFPARLGRLVPPALLALALAGCGAPTGDISGKVTLNGKPLPGGFVAFLSSGDNPAAVSGVIQPDGTYSVSRVPVGAVAITIQGVRGPAQGAGPMLPGAKSAPPPEVGKGDPVFVPYKYGNAETSGLTYTVEKGTQTHDIE